MIMDSGGEFIDHLVGFVIQKTLNVVYARLVREIEFVPENEHLYGRLFIFVFSVIGGAQVKVNG